MSAQLDRAFLSAHDSSVSNGVAERVFHVDSGTDRCFALLYRPAEPRDQGFVVCHSYGLEFLTLRRTERAIAHALAGLGYPVLGFHARGYGDSTGDLAAQTLDCHLEDVARAADHLRDECGTRRIGYIGARFGGLVAGLAARAGAERLVLVNPALGGAAYFRQMIREASVVGIAAGDGGTGRDGGPMAALRREGVADVLGYAVHRHLLDAASQVDLTADVGAFGGSALVFCVSRRATVPRDVEAFRARVEAAGGTCRVEALKEPARAPFGGPAFVSTADPTVRVDAQEPVVSDIASITTEWMSG